MNKPFATITRFAPSPTGRLHIGHAFSALFGWKQAREAGGTFILRIEDIDTGRCRPEFETGIYEDLSWLGLDWEKPARRQSDHFDDYRAALGKLEAKGLLYPCFCSRKDIQAADSAPHDLARGPEGALYPGICRTLDKDDAAARIAAGAPYALRLNMDKAVELAGTALRWVDRAKGEFTATPEILGDVVLARKDTPASYHLCVCVDDHLQGVTLVTRGEDLLYATHLHRLLQEILELNVPEYHHHHLLLDAEGKRFAKRNNAVTLAHMREVEGKSATDIIRMTGLTLMAALAACTFLTLPAHAQDIAHEQAVAQEPTLEEDIGQFKQTNKRNQFITMSSENDKYGGGTDQHYTNGARISYFNTDTKVPEFVKNVAEIVPMFKVNETTGVSYSIGQNLYTPADISIEGEQPNERPYAGWLYGSMGLITAHQNHTDEVELTLGVVGPSAQGEPVQKAVHDTFNMQDPKGWEYQLSDEPGVILSWKRRWPRALDFEAGGMYAAIEPNVDVSVGNVYTYAGTGFMMRFGPYEDRFQDAPPRVRPAIPGTGYFQSPDDGFGWYLFAGADGRAMARNIFLDGNTFRDSPSVDKEIFVGDLTAGLATTFDRFRVSYSMVYRTPEFKGQDDGDVFGSISLGVAY